MNKNCIKTVNKKPFIKIQIFLHCVIDKYYHLAFISQNKIIYTNIYFQSVYNNVCYGGCRLSRLKSILFIISRLWFNFIHKCVFVFLFCFSYSFFNYKQKTGKNVAHLKLNNFHSFKRRVNFLTPVCSGHYFE